MRLCTAVAAVAGLLPALVGAAPVQARIHNHIEASQSGARPGHAVTISGTAPRCAMQPFETYQGYTNRDGSRVSSQGAPGVSGGDGAFSFVVTVPSDAVRSNIL